jgi:hypothetical protein
MRRVVSLACLITLVSVGAVLTSGCTTTARSGLIDEAIFDSQSEFVVETLVRGQPVRLKVDPGAPWYVLLNGSAAKRIGLVGTRGATFAVGPMRLKGKTRSEKFTFGTIIASRPVIWFKGESIRGADGIVNPANVPRDRVTMRLGMPSSGEKIIELPMRFDRERGLYHELSFGGQIILTRFTLQDDLTTATGAAASVIAKRRNGLWEGDVFTYPVRYGISRPVRKMVLGEPLSVNGLSLSKLTVRVSDDRGSYYLPEQQAAVARIEDEDEDDVVVTGERGRIYGAPHFWLMIARDNLNRCSSISYDNAAKRLRMSCAPTAQEAQAPKGDPG